MRRHPSFKIKTIGYMISVRDFKHSIAYMCYLTGEDIGGTSIIVHMVLPLSGYG